MSNFLKELLPGPLKCFASRFNNPFLSLWQSLRGRNFSVGENVFNFPPSAFPFLTRSMLLFDVYEKSERELVDCYLTEDDSVLELGACLGVMGVCVSKRIKRDNKHLVVEANPFLIPYLYQNRKQNGGNFQILHGLVGDGMFGEINLGDTALTTTSYDAPTDTSSTFQVPTVDIDSLQKKYGRFDSLIMDIEGSELDLIRNHLKDFEGFKKLIIEFHPEVYGTKAQNYLSELLGSIGFDCQCEKENSKYFLRS